LELILITLTKENINIIGSEDWLTFFGERKNKRKTSSSSNDGKRKKQKTTTSSSSSSSSINHVKKIITPAQRLKNAYERFLAQMKADIHLCGDKLFLEYFPEDMILQRLFKFFVDQPSEFSKVNEEIYHLIRIVYEEIDDKKSIDAYSKRTSYKNLFSAGDLKYIMDIFFNNFTSTKGTQSLNVSSYIDSLDETHKKFMVSYLRNKKRKGTTTFILPTNFKIGDRSIYVFIKGDTKSFKILTTHTENLEEFIVPQAITTSIKPRNIIAFFRK